MRLRFTRKKILCFPIIARGYDLEHIHGPIFPPKKSWLFFLTSLVLPLAGSFLTIDLLHFFLDLNFEWVVFLKLGASLLTSITVWSLGRNALDGWDYFWLGLAFVCTFLGDAFLVTGLHIIPESLYVTLGTTLLLLAQIVLIIRHSKAFSYFWPEGKFRPKRLLFPLAFYVPIFVGFGFIASMLWNAGLFHVGLIFSLVLSTSLWVGWATVRYHLYPTRNALMIGIGLASFFLMQIAAAIQILNLGYLSEIASLLTWALYTPFLILLPYSGVDWER